MSAHKNQVGMSVYIIDVCIHLSLSIYLSFYLSLSLSIYIYIYIYVYISLSLYIYIYSISCGGSAYQLKTSAYRHLTRCFVHHMFRTTYNNYDLGIADLESSIPNLENLILSPARPRLWLASALRHARQGDQLFPRLDPVANYGNVSIVSDVTTTWLICRKQYRVLQSW